MGRDADVWAYLKTTRPPGPLSGGRSFLQAQLQFGPPGLSPGLASPRDVPSRGDPFGSDFLGGNEFRLRQGFGGAKTLGRRCAPSLLGKREVRGLRPLTGAAPVRPAGPQTRACIPTGCPIPWDPFGSDFLGGNEFRLRQGFGGAKTLGRRCAPSLLGKREVRGLRPLTGAAPVRPAGPQTRACPGGRTYSAYRLPRRADRRGSPPGDSRRARRRIQRNR